MERDKLYVYANLEHKDYFLGTLSVIKSSDRFYSTFRYSQEWLNKPFAYSLGYELPLKNKDFICNNEIGLFKAFAFSYSTDIVDFYFEYLLLYLINNNLYSAEDFNKNDLYNWVKTASVRSEKFGRCFNVNLNPLTNISNANDYTRCGNLRFKLDLDGDFVQNFDKKYIPDINSISNIIQILNNIKSNSESPEQLEQFHACVSGLGGRKPKTSVFDNDGNLCIAKLSPITDLRSEFIVERLALLLANKFNIKTQEYFIQKNDKNEEFIVIKRFDRIGTKRIPFLKLNNFIRLEDFDNDEAIVKAFKMISKKNYKKNLKEFFRRKLFRIAITNTNAHIPNTGFLYDTHLGWILAPEYDITCGYELLRTINDVKRCNDYYVSLTRNEIKNLISKSYLYFVGKRKARKMLKELKIALKDYEKDLLSLGFDSENIFRIKIYKEALSKI